MQVYAPSLIRDGAAGGSPRPDASFRLPAPEARGPGLAGSPAPSQLSPVVDDGNGILDAGDLRRATPVSPRDLGAALAARAERVVVIGDYHTSSTLPGTLDAAIAAAVARGQSVTAGLEIPAHPDWAALVEARNAGRISPGAFRERFLDAGRSIHGGDDPRPALFLSQIDRAFAGGARVVLLDPPNGGVADAVMTERALEGWRRHGSDRLFLEVGNIHAQGRPGIARDLTALGADAANPFGRRLEERLGAQAVLTVATVPANVLGPAVFRPPFDSWDAVVRLVPEPSGTRDGRG